MNKLEQKLLQNLERFIIQQSGGKKPKIEDNAHTIITENLNSLKIL